MTTQLSRPVRVFLAEDNRADVLLVKMALKEHQIPFSLRVVEDGEDALACVERFGNDEPIPDIALLDLNLPRQDGDQVMRSLRERACCDSMPIVVMTSAGSDRDRSRAEQYRAVFFVKPADLSGFLTLGGLVKSLCVGLGN